MSRFSKSLLPKIVTAIAHPLVNSAYLKKEFSAQDKSEDVLIIETNLLDDSHHDAYDMYMATFMNDLHDLRLQAESQVGHIDRIEIRS